MGKRARQVRGSKSHGRDATAPTLRPAATPAAAGTRANRADLVTYLLLFVLTLSAYSRSLHFDFVNLDDPDYVTDNPHVRAGLTWDGVRWAFNSFYAANWSPLTWLSHMTDCQLFGVQSGWHHFSSVLLHAAAALLLFAALKRLTAARWPSAFAAFIFALHPLHVESVAWIAERKDVLCALFWFLALWSYARYAERPGPGRYLLVLAAFCLGLMAKPMIITLPFVLLLLDAWPLRRLNRRAVWEKAPFFLLAGASGVITFLAQKGGHAVISLAAVPFSMRLENAIVAYAAYIGRMFWPAKLAVFYPYPNRLPTWQVAAAGAALAAATAAVLYWRRAHPYLATGWFWYLGTLVPVIGLVQVGAQASADRYTYVPMVGIAIVLAWGAAELTRRHALDRRAVAAAAAVACAVCWALTWRQAGYWQDNASLYQHAIEATRENFVAHNNLASYYLVQMRNQEALPHIREALRIKPDYSDTHTNLALFLQRLGHKEQAEMEYRTSLSLQPANPGAHSGYGALLLTLGRNQEALREFAAAEDLRPGSAQAHSNLGRALAALGRQDAALAEFSEAVRLRPDDAEALHSLGFALLGRGRMEEALVQLGNEVRLKPDDASLHYTVGSLLASTGRWDEAIGQFSEAVRIRPDMTVARKALETARARQVKTRER